MYNLFTKYDIKLNVSYIKKNFIQIIIRIYTYIYFLGLF